MRSLLRDASPIEVNGPTSPVKAEELARDDGLGEREIARRGASALASLHIGSKVKQMSRKRSNSVKQALDSLEPSASYAERPVASPKSGADAKAKKRVENVAHVPPAASSAVFGWLVNPMRSLAMIATTVAVWAAIEYTHLFAKNPLNPVLFISYPLTPTVEELAKGETATRYDKGPLDIVFLLFYIIVFSFLRQSITEYVIKPICMNLGLKGKSKITRFMEQAYAIVYFTASGSYGLYVMSHQKSWWYQTEHFWLEFPHWRMEGALKSYYLLQLSYWCQQMLVLCLRLEKPRSDFKELVIHHIVTLWLVGWSYTINLTMIGTAIFVSMDIPDIFLALSKCVNYLDLQRASEVSFVFFLCIWHYMRHYLNIRILISVWNDFELIPVEWRSWTASAAHPTWWWLFTDAGRGQIPPWIKLQIFAPILALQLVNTFWSYLIWRILFRMLFGKQLADVREEGEDSEDEKSVEETKKSR